MTPEEFAEVLQLGETRKTEFKGPGELRLKPGQREDRELTGKVFRAILAMANVRDGGRVVVGIREKDDPREPDAVGVSEEQARTWTYDNLATAVNNYADPYVRFDISPFEYEQRKFIDIRVHQFDAEPVICSKCFTVGDGTRQKTVLSQGALYTRSRARPESVPVPSTAEMREILNMAVDLGVRDFVRRADQAGLAMGKSSDEESFRRQLGDF